jgi:hypothetical protein
MDTSAEYANMCTQAAVLRKLWKPARGDYYYSRNTGEKCALVLLSDKTSKVNKVWLPRLDQLFALIEERYNVPGKPAYALNKFHQYLLAYSPRPGGSMEQLLFQFVMHELYNLHYSTRTWKPYPPNITL